MMLGCIKRLFRRRLFEIKQARLMCGFRSLLILPCYSFLANISPVSISHARHHSMSGNY